jgi:hypothetical protein
MNKSKIIKYLINNNDEGRNLIIKNDHKKAIKTLINI